ncbi:MAG: hypothetical protein Q9167_008053, partial [Letrouitia subvulpina]
DLMYSPSPHPIRLLPNSIRRLLSLFRVICPLLISLRLLIPSLSCVLFLCTQIAVKSLHLLNQDRQYASLIQCLVLSISGVSVKRLKIPSWLAPE